MSGVFVVRQLLGAAWRLSRRASHMLHDVILGTEEDAVGNRDPVMEVVVQNPQEAFRFIKLVMLFGATTGVGVSTPCATYLGLFWSDCYCNRPLQWWVLVFTALQLAQVPIRLIFFLHLSNTPRDGAVIVRTVRRLTGGCGWRCSKLLSIFSYGWLILGFVWIFNATYCHDAQGLWRLAVAAIVVSMIRLAATFICFWVAFPPNSVNAGNGDGNNASIRLYRGASMQEINALPIFVYKDKKSILIQKSSKGDVRLDGDGDFSGSGDGGGLSTNTQEEQHDRRLRHRDRLKKKQEQDTDELLRHQADLVSSAYESCCICLSEFVDEDFVRELGCLHFFHKGCIDTWLVKNRKCPLCQRSIEDYTAEKLSY